MISIAHRIDPRYKTYAEAQEFCKNETMNGFTTGRLLEPKTQSFLDKVYFESELVFGYRGVTGEINKANKHYLRKDTWMGIIRINTTSYQGNKWVYASSGDDLEFQNVYGGGFRYKLDIAECAILHVSPWKNHQGWFDQLCYLKHAVICEFL